jgi:hypothetical protein
MDTDRLSASALQAPVEQGQLATEATTLGKPCWATHSPTPLAVALPQHKGASTAQVVQYHGDMCAAASG